MKEAASILPVSFSLSFCLSLSPLHPLPGDGGHSKKENIQEERVDDIQKIVKETAAMLSISVSLSFCLSLSPSLTWRGWPEQE